MSSAIVTKSVTLLEGAFKDIPADSASEEVREEWAKKWCRIVVRRNMFLRCFVF
jgi:hypothetical protein